MLIDLDRLWHKLSGEFALGIDSIHGPEHWRRVERHGVCAAEQLGGDVLVVRLFAVLHDACRINERDDEGHGARGAALAAQLRGEYFTLSDEQFALLDYACTWHTAGELSSDPTIGACWDADRLDMWRVDHAPSECYMSTDYGRNLVNSNHIGPEFVP